MEQETMGRRHTLSSLAIPIVCTFVLIIALIGMPYYLPSAWLNVIGVGPSKEVTKTTSGQQVTTKVRETGAKTVWDWAELLLVPLVLALGGYWFQQRREREARILEERQRQESHKLEAERMNDAVTQAYLDQMTQLLLHEGLRTSENEAEVRSVARARTLTALRVLDASRKATIVQFLYEAGLITASKWPVDAFGFIIAHSSCEPASSRSEEGAYVEALQRAGIAGETMKLRSKKPREKVGIVVDLSGADLTGVNLAGCDLDGISLSGTNLSGANFAGANLTGASLIRANLTAVNFAATNLTWSDLVCAELKKTNFSDADLTRLRLRPTSLATIDDDHSG